MVSLQTIKAKRNVRIDQEGTAPFSFLNSADIGEDSTNDGGLVIDFENESKTSKYYPYDFIQISNNSSVALNVYINQNREWKKRVPSGVIQVIDDFKGVRSVRIAKTASTTVNAGEVEVTVLKKPLSEDEKIRREQKANPVRAMVRHLLGV